MNEISQETALKILAALKRINENADPVTEETGLRILKHLEAVEAEYAADPLANQ